MLKKLDEWKVLLAIFLFLGGIGAGLVSWAYALGEKVEASIDRRQEVKLQNYPTFQQFQEALERMDEKRETEYKDLRDRIDVVRELVRKQ